MFGAILRAGPGKYTVAAGATSSLPVIECTMARGKHQDIFLETPQNLHMRDTYLAVIFVESLYNGLENIPVLFPANYNSLWSFEGPKSQQRSFSTVFRASPSVKVVLLYKSWINVAETIVEHVSSKAGPPVVLMAGSRSSGKSTFAKFLTNNLVFKSGVGTVYYLECDPKHSEYAPLGLVSLHKVSFDFSSAFAHSHMNNCIKAHSIGDIDPKKAFFHYISAISDLLNQFRQIQQQSKKQCSLIINTPGWTKGLGLQLLEEIFQLSKTTHIVYMGADSDTETFEDFETRFSRFDFAGVLQPATILTSVDNVSLLPGRGADRLNSLSVQNLQLLTYFHYSSSTHAYDFSQPITHFTPYAVPYAQPGKQAPCNHIQAFGIMFSDGILAEDVELCLNGTVVSLIAVSPNVELLITPCGTSDESHKANPLPYLEPKALSAAINPETSRCLGLGLIQSIDRRAQKIRLLTPIDCSTELQQVDLHREKLILVRGSIQYPSEDMSWINDASGSKKFVIRDPVTKKKLDCRIPFFSDSEPVGAESHVVSLRQSLE